MPDRYEYKEVTSGSGMDGYIPAAEVLTKHAARGWRVVSFQWGNDASWRAMLERKVRDERES